MELRKMATNNRLGMNSGKARDDNWSMLLQRVGQERDESAFSQLFKHFSPLIRGFCINQAGGNFSADHTDEIIQEVMFKVWQKAPSYNATKSAASTWIYTVMRNCRIDVIRKNQRHNHYDSDPVNVDDLWDEDHENQPFIELQQARNESVIRESFKELPLEQRQALNQVYMQGKSHGEIAQTDNLPLGTVKSRVRMGLKKLQQSITKKQAIGQV